MTTALHVETTVLFGLVAVVAVHEFGHAFAAQTLRLPWTPVLSRRGPGIRVGSESFRLTTRQMVATAIAGPLASLVFAAVLWPTDRFLALCSIEIAVWNLVLPRSDGAAVLRALRGKETYTVERER